MKSILFIRGAYGKTIGGIERKILTIAMYLADKNILNPILATSDKRSTFSEKFREMGFPVLEIPMRKIAGVRRSAEIAKDILKKHDIKIIQSHMFRESLIGRNLRIHNPDVKHFFRVHTHIAGSNIPIWRQMLYHLLDHYTEKGVDCFIPISNTVKNELIKKSRIRSACVKTVCNGIPSLGIPDPPVMEHSRLKPCVAIIGNIQRRKQQAIAVESIGILFSKGINVDLHLIGLNTDNSLSKVKYAAKRNNVEHLIHIHGYKNLGEIYDTIKDISVVLLPSLFEGMPTSILEGMSLRKLVITTPVGATPEFITHRVNGLLHPPGKPEVLADILEEVFTSPAEMWEPIRNAGYETWKEKFTLQHMMDGLINIYKNNGVV